MLLQFEEFLLELVVIPTNSKFPKILLSAAISLSPCKTLIETAG
jgi:hypothetical protein